jgi:hypothetical protein
MRKIGNRGSALILVMVSAIVLSILVAAVYTLFQANTRSQAWAKERIQARFTAESGMNLAIHMIMEGADVPQGDDPIQFLPEIGDWEFMGDDLGWVQVWVDPHHRNSEVGNANAYEVRCLAKVMDEDQEWMYGIASMVLPRNFAVYATFLNQVGMGYYGDGYRFDGPFHANAPVQLYSKSAGRNNDPWFYSFSVAADHYLYGTWSVQSATTPHFGNLWIEPYEKMLMGEPYFTLNADTVPFGSGVVGWEGARTAANSGGLVLNLPDETRMILLEDTLLVKTDSNAVVQVYDLGSLSNNVVWINNGANGTVYLKTEEEYGPAGWREHGLPDSLALTIGVTGNLAISGPLLYHSMDLTDDSLKCMMGLLTVYGDFMIAADPDEYGGIDWSHGGDKSWDISTCDYDKMEIDAVVMVLDGLFQIEDFAAGQHTSMYDWPMPAIDLEIVGGYIINEEGITSWEYSGGSAGFLTFCTYDPRLMTRHPPYFPQTGIWDTAYWDERPDMSDAPSAGDDYIGFNLI